MAWTTKKQPGSYGGRPWRRLRDSILRRDCGLCQPCLGMSPPRMTLAAEVHHVVPKANGGTDDPSNLVAICASCHEVETMRQLGRAPRPKYDINGRRITDPQGVEEINPIDTTG